MKKSELNFLERHNEVSEYAISHGGSVISEKYTGNKNLMSFKCSEGHFFDTTYQRIKRYESWCTICMEEQQKCNVDTVSKYVIEKGGAFSGDFTTVKSRFKLICKDGHGWETTAERLIYHKRWCPECAKSTAGERLTFGKVCQIANERDGECLASSMSNRMALLPFVCKEGHTWNTSAFSLFYAGTWCPTCAIESSKNGPEEKKAGLLRLKRAANTKNGECLSSNYKTINDYYDFQCSEGHTWSCIGRNFLLGNTWCPECSGKLGETLSVEFIRKITGLDFKKVRPKWLKGFKGKSLEIDAYCEDLKLAIEYQGKQHYEFIPAWHKTQEYFQECQARDELKRQLCTQNGVTLFEIPFIEKPNKESVEDHIESLAAEACLPYAFNPEYRQFLKESAEAGVSLERSESFKAD